LVITLTLSIVAALASIACVVPAGASTVTPGRVVRKTGAGGIGLRLVDVPANTRVDPRAQIYVVDHLAAGTVITRRIQVSNTTASTVHVNLYAAAAAIANGTFQGAAGRIPNDVSTWTSVVPGVADVPADGRATALVSLTVPRDAAPGERYGVVWAEARSVPQVGGGITQISRVGIRLYISIGAGRPPASNFAIKSLTAERAPDGRPNIVATVQNTGGRALDMSGTLRLSAGPAGLSAGPFPATLGTTLGVGDSAPVTIALDKRIPAGPWDAAITLRSGLLERSARATITFPASGSARPAKTTSIRPPWSRRAIADLVVLVAFGIPAWLVALRRRRGSSPTRLRAST
jgi:hypothetical protein